MSESSNPVYLENGKWVFRVSGLGTCQRALQAYGMGYDPLPFPSYTLKAFSAGHEHEEICKLRIRNMGFTITNEQELLEHTTESFILRGHIDGIISYKEWPTLPPHYDNLEIPIEWRGDPAILEIKSMSEEMYTVWLSGKFNLFPNYSKQITVYMRVMGLPALYVVQNRETLELNFTYLREAPCNFSDIIERVSFIANSIKQDTDTENLIACEGSKYNCQFEYLHFGDCPDRSEDSLKKLEAKIIRTKRRFLKLMEEKNGILQRKSEVECMWKRDIDSNLQDNLGQSQLS